MRIFITGGLGFLGSHLVLQLLKRHHKLVLLVRPSKGKSTLMRVREKFGDDIAAKVNIIEGDLNSFQHDNYTKHIDKVIHVAAMLNLGYRLKDKIWKTNLEGTKNILSFCAYHKVPHIIFISTAYTHGKNAYELSKIKAEEEVKTSGILYTIIKPSIIIGSPEDPGSLQTVNQVASTIAKVHARVESTRRRVERGMALPPLILGFRLEGNPNSTMNLIPVSVVTDRIMKLLNKKGVFFVTNPNPPTVQEVTNEVGEVLMLNLRVEQEFLASPPEAVLRKLLRAYTPYMQSESKFSTVVNKDFRLEKGYITDTVRAFMSK